MPDLLGVHVQGGHNLPVNYVSEKHCLDSKMTSEKISECLNSLCTVKALIKAPLKIIMIRKGACSKRKNNFGPSEAPCLERRLRIRA